MHVSQHELVTTTANAPAIAERLDAYARHARGALASNTARALRSDVAAFTAWASRHGLEALPVDPENLAAYVDALAAGECAAACAPCAAWHSTMSATGARWQPWHRPATVRRHLASVAAYHRAAGLTSPASAEPVRLAMKRTAKRTGKRQRQAPALRWNDARRIFAALGESLGDLRDAALLSVAVDTFARRSELVALDVADLALDADGSGSILIRHSKTDQEGEGMNRELMPDTVRRVRAWLAAAGISSGPLFRSVKYGRTGERRLPAGDVPRAFRRVAERAGISTPFTGHSSRVGSAQDMAGDGFTVVEIMLAGGWKSPVMVGRYAERLDQKRTANRRAALHGRV